MHRDGEMGLAGRLENLRLGQDGHGAGNIISPADKTKARLQDPECPLRMKPPPPPYW
jgi:hypothetical protein